MTEKKYTFELTEDDLRLVVDALIHEKEYAVVKSTFEQYGALIDRLGAPLEELYKNKYGGQYDAK